MNYTYTFCFALGGLWLGQLPGAVVGGFIGFMIDKLSVKRHQRYTDVDGFIEPLFALMGAVAKSDGRVSEAEIAATERMMARMNLGAVLRQRAVASFNRGKQPEFDINPVIHALHQWVGMYRPRALPVLDMVLEGVLAGGNPSSRKMTILRQLAQTLRVSDMELMAMMAMKGYVWQADERGRGSAYASGGGHYVPPTCDSQEHDPYAVLGIAVDVDDRAVKRAYRKLISRHHPDRLGNLPAEMRQRAEVRAREINAAYDRIKAQRGFK